MPATVGGIVFRWRRTTRRSPSEGQTQGTVLFLFLLSVFNYWVSTTLDTANATAAATAAATDALFARPWRRIRLTPARRNGRTSGGTMPARHADLDVSARLPAQNGLTIQNVEQTLVCL